MMMIVVMVYSRTEAISMPKVALVKIRRFLFVSRRKKKRLGQRKKKGRAEERMLNSKVKADKTVT